MVSSKLDKELGVDREITRRDFLYGSSLLIGSALAGCDTPQTAATAPPPDYNFGVGNDWYGPGGSGDYARSHGNTPGLVQAAHEIRAGRFSDASVAVSDSGEE